MNSEADDSVRSEPTVVLLFFRSLSQASATSNQCRRFAIPFHFIAIVNINYGFSPTLDLITEVSKFTRCLDTVCAISMGLQLFLTPLLFAQSILVTGKTAVCCVVFTQLTRCSCSNESIVLAMAGMVHHNLCFGNLFP